MLKTLQFVRGAVSTKDLVPVLTHFCVRDGRLQGQNGWLALDAPCPELASFDIVVPADKFLRAVDTCGGEPKLVLSKDVLTVSLHRFRAKLQTLAPEQYPFMEREVAASADTSRDGRGLIEMLRTIQPFISTDASRPWSCSVLITDRVAFATNNVLLACVDYDWGKEDLVLPGYTVAELLRIGQEPTWVGWNSNRFVADYGDGSWLCSRLIEGAWPDTLHSLHQDAKAATDWSLTTTMASAVDKLRPFFPDAKMPVVLTGPDGIKTQDGQSSAEIDIEGLPVGAYRYESLSQMLTVATHWAPHRFPKAVPWKGDGILGMIMGVRI